ncbi:MAG: alpha/beta hydrolase [Victivallaceae bacterium]|nr:alpha/beta hydrolase [Victivallaceae bacterium]
MPNTVINDIDVYYEIHGQGEPLMLIAGLASDSRSWGAVVEALTPHFQVIVFDNRGVGRTKPQDVEINVPQMADDAVALLDNLGLSKVNILGHSMGGFIAQDLTIRYPEYVNRLILAGTAAAIGIDNNKLLSDLADERAAGMELSEWFKAVFRLIFSKKFNADEVAVAEALQYALDDPYPQSAIGFSKQVKAITDYDCSEQLTAVQAKTLVVGGENDILFTPAICQNLTESLPHAELAIIVAAPHSIHSEQPQAFSERVLKFLSS